MVVMIRGFVLVKHTTSLNYEFNIIFVVRNWYETDTCKLIANDLAPGKTTSLYYEANGGFVPRNWYGTDRRTHGWRDGGKDRETETRVKDLLASGVQYLQKD